MNKLIDVIKSLTVVNGSGPKCPAQRINEVNLNECLKAVHNQLNLSAVRKSMNCLEYTLMLNYFSECVAVVAG